MHLLFICLGNICRSPLAEGVFLAHARERGVADRFTVDSAGTGDWHAGALADPRMRATAERHGITLTSRARQVQTEDFDRFDALICMDESNRETILERGAPPDRVSLLLEHAPDARLLEVPDPYHGDDDGFELVFGLVDDACRALLDHLLDGQSS